MENEINVREGEEPSFFTRRCSWADSDPLLRRYHDEEWGRPVHDDNKHFEALSMEVMQCGLSWMTVLRKKEVLRKAFCGFDPEKVALLTDADIGNILRIEGMIRSEKKIRAVIANAICFIHIKREWGSFSSYIWSFTEGRVMEYPSHADGSIVVSRNELSERISADMKRRGFRFLGPVTIYSYLQAVGIINDHLSYCFLYHHCF